jgi:superoxide dismutase
MTITLPELPFEKDALAPFISEKTIDFSLWETSQDLCQQFGQND